MTQWAYDAASQVTAVTDPLGGVTTYKYDAFDRRIAKDVDNDGDGTFDRGERYVYDGSDIVLVFTDAGAVTERLLYGPAVDQPLASEDGSGDVRWMLADNQGTVRDVAEYDAGQDETNVVNHLQYGSFGNITAQTNSSEEPRHTYTGREWDADTELYYYRARWYDAAVGRFISEDPLGFNGDPSHLTRYVGNSPTNYNDPSGLIGEGWEFEFVKGELVSVYVPGFGYFTGRAAMQEALLATGAPMKEYYDVLGRLASEQAASLAAAEGEATAAAAAAEAEAAAAAEVSTAAGGSIWTAEVTGATAAGLYTVIAAEALIVGYELYLIDYYWDEVKAYNAVFHNSRMDFLIDQGMTWKAAEEKAIKEAEAFEATIPGYWDYFYDDYIKWMEPLGYMF